MSIRRRRHRSLLIGATVVGMSLLASGLGTAAPPSSEWTGAVKRWDAEGRNLVPEDRYAMAGGCYVARALDAGYLSRSDEAFTATGDAVSGAEPFHFQATDLGSYLLYGTSRDFLSASEGAVGEAGYAVTRSHPGAIAGGVLLGKSDEAANAAARSEANQGRGSDIVSDDEPSPLADWLVVEEQEGSFSFSLPETDQALIVTPEGELDLAEGGPGSAFSLELAEGCEEYPEIEVNVEGPIVGGKSSFQEVRGHMDLHLHMMAFEFLGGRARCGRPWHRYGVRYALVDCPDHEPGGHGALLEQILTKETPGTPHNTDGWPSFEGWPKHDSLTHEQVYYKWLERAWRGGLRMFTNLLVDNNQLCKIYPFKRNSCNEMDGVRLQAQRIHELQDYIDAQSGGPGEGWFRIVEDPFEAREVINEGKLAVVLGIEVSVPLDCGLTLDVPECGEQDIEDRLDEVYDLGVRQMELVNKFDNALSGVAGDEGSTGVVVNGGNFLETGRFWQMETCHDHEGHAHDRQQMNFHDESGAPDEFTGRDALAGAVLATSGRSGAVPLYPEGPHCNTLGLSDLGKKMIRGMVERGMIFDPDHMSARAQTQALDLIESEEIQSLEGEPGLVSSHGWSNETIYPRIYKNGGVVTPYAGGSSGFAEHWAQHREWADDRYVFGFGYGADTNGFGSQGGPRSDAAADPVTYPFDAFGGVTVDQQQSGTRSYDINADGVAHYGLYPDWIEDLRRIAGDQIIEDMLRGPEAYLQMWERAIGIAPDSCRADIADLTENDVARVHRGMSTEQVLEALGQPRGRSASAFTYCFEGDRTLTLRFKSDGSLSSWSARPVKG